MSNRFVFLPALLLTILLSACSTSQTARPVAQVRTGQIEHVKVVTINDTSGIGSIAGGIVGGILAGKHIGNGSGSTISSVFGALLGGFLGNQMEREIAQKTAQELTIRMLDNNERLVVVQDVPQVFMLGQTVDVISNGQTARVQAQELKK
ncbi:MULTISPECIES: glycine zipper 2TM domain-containing protein [Deefgea]|uniref:Glycine zipper 2TM domain-containing protein n=1 Tax=Deefgea chitinilytica TaxID=570276 RepID=A0ABS2CEG9_9NEIS|nr:MULTISPECIES: glycine zipper 2TM domain-containing protein [Deefgea]MBM5572537.1 glycine zipper 2TM domain-containing protein [Deefgea chitinilytica]MBM9889773.1 glycine zipper 2TM domain-containing protein [Deefgea sp. CFH1-16]